jgi:hypothetical protein
MYVNAATTMSTSHALSAGFLGASGPLKPTFGSCSVSVQPKLSATKKASSTLIACSLGHDLNGSGNVTFRNKDYYDIIKESYKIVIGSTGMYMRSFMHNKANLNSHHFQSEDLAEWDCDLNQAYFMYQHRADLFQRLDLWCEQQVLELLEEISSALDLGVEAHSNNVAHAIGYEEAMDLLLEARQSGGIVTEQRFLEFLLLFQHNCKSLVEKQVAWLRQASRSDVGQFRWVNGEQHMVDALVGENERPVGKGKELIAMSLKDQKHVESYKSTLEVYSYAGAVERVLRWIKSTQGPR